MIWNYIETTGLVSLHTMFRNLVALVITSGKTTEDYRELQVSRKLEHRPQHYNCFLSRARAPISRVLRAIRDCQLVGGKSHQEWELVKKTSMRKNLASKFDEEKSPHLKQKWWKKLNNQSKIKSKKSAKQLETEENNWKLTRGYVREQLNA